MKVCLQRAAAVLLLAVLLIAGAVPGVAQATEITVCPSGCNYTGIQEAINNASPGDTIRVMSGSYHEVIDVNKSVTLTGVPDTGGAYPHIGQYTRPVAVTISAPGVVFDGFNPYGAGEHAIEITMGNVTIRNVTASIHRPSYEGDAIIDGNGLSGITITDCMMQSTGTRGIHFRDSQGITIERNLVIVSNTSEWASLSGVGFDFSATGADYSGFTVVNNTIIGGPVIFTMGEWTDGLQPGVNLARISDNTVSGSSYQGIAIEGFPDTTEPEEMVLRQSDFVIKDNRVSSCSGGGIYVTLIETGEISGNEVTGVLDWGEGLYIGECSGFIVEDNIISDCKGEDMTGLMLNEVTASMLSGNLLNGNTYSFGFQSLQHPVPMLTIDDTNLADGKPIRYYEGVDGLTVDGDEVEGAGYYFVDCRDISATKLAPYGAYQGISITNCRNVSLTHSAVEGCAVAVDLIQSSDSIIFTNLLTRNRNGFRIYGLNNSQVWRNDVYNSTWYGITLFGNSNDLWIANNRVNYNFLGMYSGSSIPGPGNGRLTIEGNELSHNSRGFIFSGTSSMAVQNNLVSHSTGPGITLRYSQNSSFTGNHIEYNNPGVMIQERSYLMPLSVNNTFSDNFFNNYNQVVVSLPVGIEAYESGEEVKTGLMFDKRKVPVIDEPLPAAGDPNRWNVTKTPGDNIIGGPYLGGNYWASPDGTGFSETHPDRGDGFCNEAYVFNEWNTDYLPLHTYTPKPSFYADFSVAPSSGNAPLTVKCTDSSLGSPTLFSYNFGDGTNASGPSPSHTYRFPGTYNITLTITKFNRTSASVMSSTTTKVGVVKVTGIPFVRPVAGFTASPVTGRAPLTVKFTDQSTGNPAFYNYDFGDGVNVTGPEPSHTYRLPGTYNVTLTVTKFDAVNGTVVMDQLTRNGLIVVSAKTPK